MWSEDELHCAVLVDIIKYKGVDWSPVLGCAILSSSSESFWLFRLRSKSFLRVAWPGAAEPFLFGEHYRYKVVGHQLDCVMIHDRRCCRHTALRTFCNFNFFSAYHVNCRYHSHLQTTLTFNWNWKVFCAGCFICCHAVGRP